MPITIEFPQIGESITEGTIVRWLKQPGEQVAQYEPLVEVETDKVTMEIPSSVTGRVVGLLVEEGTNVSVGAPICEIEVEGEVLGAEPDGKGSVGRRTGVLVEAQGAVGPTGALPIQELEPARVQAPAVPLVEQFRLSPVVQKLVAEHGMPREEVARIARSGRGGRVTKQDVLKHLDGRAIPAQVVQSPVLEALPEADEETIPLTAVRRRIAVNMVRSAREIPAAWNIIEADVTGLVRCREGAKGEFLIREKVELTYLPFMVQAVAKVLKGHPRLNSQWGGDSILLKRRINISIAMAAPQGLVVPVVHDADRSSVAGLARIIADLLGRARSNTLSLVDVQGGTFTVNNTGALGSVVSQPIINHPQAAILTTEAVLKRPVVVNDAIVIRSMMNVCLTFDHRVIDGQEAGAFLQGIRQRLEAIDEETAIY